MSLNNNSSPQWGIKKWGLWILCILIFILLVYLPLHQNNFLISWDDNRYVLDNPHIKALNLNSSIQTFSIFYDGHYHPLTLLSLAVDYQLSGLNPRGYHVTNLVLHLINTFLVFWLVFLLFEKRDRTIPLVTALLFGISTMHVESVAWASERKNLLFATFFLLSLIVYLRYLKTDRTWIYFVALALFVCSLLSKVMAIPLSITLFLVDYFLNRNLLSRKVWLEKIPFLLIAIIFGVVAIIAQKSSWGDHLSQEHFSFFERILFSGYAFVTYIVKLIIPYKLSGFYPYPKDVGGFIVIRNVLFVLISIVIVLGAFYYRNKRKTVSFGLLFFVINIFLLLKLFEVPAGDYIMADRYAYIPSVGIFILIATGFKYLISSSILLKRIGISLLVVYVLFLSLQTFNRLSVWRDDITFYTDVISKYPEAELAYTNRGAIRKENHQYTKALADFNKAIQLGKNDFKAYANRGAVYSDLGQYEKAVIDYKKAASLNTGNPDILASYGFAQLQTGDFNGAIKTLNESLAIHGLNPEAYTNRGTAKFNLGDFEGAIADYEIASAQDPTYVNAHFNRGLAKINAGDLESAISDFNKAIRINPNHFESYSNMGIAWSKLGDFKQAFESYDKAIKINPNYFEAWLNRGVDKYYLNDYNGSLSDLTKALEINPNMAPAYYFRAMILLNSDKNASCEDLNKAASLGFNAAISLLNKHCK
jgi:tetratricopeptide (TPR) repeat protein